MPVKLDAKVVSKGPGLQGLINTVKKTGWVSLGVQGEDALRGHPNSNMTVGDLAYAHEVGLIRGAPERSWLWAWLTRNEGRIWQEGKAVASRVALAAARKAPLAGPAHYLLELTLLANEWAEDIRRSIRDGEVKPALAPATVQKKGHDIPLLETGTLVNAVTGVAALRRGR